MKITNLAKFQADMQAAVSLCIEQHAVPAVKGYVLGMARLLIEGGEGYAGTPEWKGNAAANWYLTFDTPATGYTQVFAEPVAPGEPGYVAPSPWSGNSPRAAAVSMSLNRVRAALLSSPTRPTEIYITNTAPQLLEYQPYGDGPLFREINRFPMSPVRAVDKATARFNTAQFYQMNQLKAAGGSGR